MRRDLLFLATVALGLLAVAAYLRASRPERPTIAAGAVAALESGQRRNEVVRLVDQVFRQHWQQHHLHPAQPASNLLVCRRLSLALTGTIPSLEELRTLETIPADEQVTWWLDHVLSDRRYADYMAERFARVLVGVEEGPFLVYRRRRFTHWLSDRLHTNIAYDRLVEELICADGLWTDAPAVNFLTVTAAANDPPHPDEQKLAARTARAFLGVRLDCVQCHDDNLGGDWLQADFHALAAFFAPARSSFFGIVDAPRAYETTYLNQTEPTAVAPTVPFESQLLSTGGDRRQQLADWVTHPDNLAFGRAIVNRAWAWLFGRPLVDPVDDIPLPVGADGARANQGLEDEVLNLLARDFLDHGCDLHRLWHNLAATTAFRLDSQSQRRADEAHESMWALFPLTRLRPEQVAGALVQSARLKTIDANSHIFVRLARHERIGDFVQRYGDLGEDELGSQPGTIPQRLLLMNGQLVQETLKDDFIGNAATRIASLCQTDEAAIDAAYLTILTRPPTDNERDHFLQRLAEAPQQRDRAIQDLCWALLNSTEFSWNH